MAGKKKGNQRLWTRKYIFMFLEKNGFHPVDVEFLNGYFLFDYGKDMVVNFHIKELRGWKFGIWWDLDNKKTFDFFAQYERDIDKFKPSASSLVEEKVAIEDGWSMGDLVQMCRFIKRHPYRAWALDQLYDMKAWEWGRLDGAFKRYMKAWWWESFWGPRAYKYLDKKYLKIVGEIADACCINPSILDSEADGVICYPRYDIVCDNFKTDKVKENGYYTFHFEQEELPHRLLKKIERYNKKVDKNAKRYFPIHKIILGDSLGVSVKGAEKCKK